VACLRQRLRADISGNNRLDLRIHKGNCLAAEFGGPQPVAARKDFFRRQSALFEFVVYGPLPKNRTPCLLVPLTKSRRPRSTFHQSTMQRRR
jgi:hypothetical protein